MDDGKIAQTEKVHFEQTEFLKRGHRKLCDDSFIGFCERYIVADRLIGDDDACRVHGDVARHTFKRTRNIDDLLDGRVLMIALAQFRGH